MKANLYPGRGSLPDWNNLDILQLGRMPARAYSITFPDQTSCRHALTSNRRYLSPYAVNINEGWEYRHYPDILQLPESILSFRSGFDPLTVPGCRLEDDAENDSSSYPFPVMPPYVPSDQAVLVCRRTCRLPLTWAGLRKKLVLLGISSACHVFLNGKMVGFTQGSYLPSEFDVTNFMHDGDNELFLLIYSGCDGSYLEKPVPGICSGIVRDVWFEAVASITIHDIQIKTTPLGSDDEWQLDLDLTLLSYRISMDCPQLRISLYSGEEVLSETTWQVPLKAADNQQFATPVQSTGRLTARLTLSSILPWNDELPNLYDLFISVEERGGHELACVHQAVGFRTVTCSQGRLILNDKPVQIRAAEWPAFRPNSRQMATVKEMIAVLRQMRQCNLNTLYLPSYPADPILLELCDIYGIMVINEAPLEISHPALLDALRDDARWVKAALDRLERLVRRDINHPCVVMWSAGLLRHQSPICMHIASQLRQWDSTRLLHYIDIADIRLNRDDSPSITLADVRQPSLKPDRHAAARCYLVWQDHDPAFLRELRQQLRPMEIEAVNALNGAFKFRSLLNWTSSTCYQVDWILMKNGRFILAGELDNIRCRPGEEQFVELPFADLNFDDGAEYLLRFEAVYAKTSVWADCGDEAFFQEFILASAERPDIEAPTSGSGRLRLESDRHHLIVSGGRFWMVFNRINGALESWRTGDKELIAASQASTGGLTGLQATTWRYLDSGDRPWTDAWNQAGFDRLIPQVLSCQDGCDGQSAVIEMVIRLAAAGQPACIEIIVRYEIRSAGDLRVFTSIRPLQPGLPPVPCFGLNLSLNRSMDQISWYGGGPEYGLPNMHESVRRGLFSGMQADPVLGINLPGNRPGVFPHVDLLTFQESGHLRLEIRSGQPFGFSARSAEHPIGKMQLSDGKVDRKALSVQLYSSIRPFIAGQPIKAIWHFKAITS